ncbi:hypothetical protein LNY53_29585 [Klebsiella pneumoniae]|nr:hypothetical protein [Klebsiella pneumoniae]
MFYSGGNSCEAVIRFRKRPRQKPVYVSVTDVLTPVVQRRGRKASPVARDAVYPEEGLEKRL